VNPKPRDPNEQIGFVLWQVQHQLQVAMESRLNAYRLSLPQFTALSLLALSPGASAAELARQLMLSPQAAHTLVTRLHAAGHVEPVPGASLGGRAIPMQVTDQGRTILIQAAAEVDHVQETFLRPLPAPERTRLLKSLKGCLPATRTAPAKPVESRRKGK
jgi:DNA-binding MarR family transcriptional regulator